MYKKILISSFLVLTILSGVSGNYASAATVRPIIDDPDMGSGGTASGPFMIGNDCYSGNDGICNTTLTYNKPIPSQVFYSVENVTRGITTTNAFYLGKYYLSNTYGQGANMLANGENKLILRNQATGAILETLVLTGRCEIGLSYVNGKCSSPATIQPVASTGSVTVDPQICHIEAGASQCKSYISWKVNNPVAGKTEMTQTSVTGASNLSDTSYQDSFGPTLSYKYGEKTITYVLKNNGITLDTKTAKSVCVTGTTWNGSICAKPVATNPAPVTNAPNEYSSGSFSVKSCTIFQGRSTCGASLIFNSKIPVQVFYNIENVTNGITTRNVFYKDVYTFNYQFGSWANMLTEGENKLNLRDSVTNAILETVVVTAKCDIGLVSVDKICVPGGDVTPVTTPSAGGTYNPAVPPGIVTTPVVTLPYDTATQKPLLKVDQNTILVRGIVQSINDNAYTIRTIGGTWTAKVTPSTLYVSLNGKRPAVIVGDYVGASGKILEDESYTFMVSAFRNRTLYQ